MADGGPNRHRGKKEHKVFDQLLSLGHQNERKRDERHIGQAMAVAVEPADHPVVEDGKLAPEGVTIVGHECRSLVTRKTC